MAQAIHYEQLNESIGSHLDFIIYYKEYANASRCPTCGLLRWKIKGKGGEGKAEKVPWKVLRYFPITPRLQSLFMSSKKMQI